MKAVTQHFIGTTEEWKRTNPKLYNAVWGFEITKDKDKDGNHIILVKVGNGKDRWNELKYFSIENIKGLKEKILELENKEVIHDDTLTGTGLDGSPLSVQPGALSGITSRAALTYDGTNTFELPEDFMYSKPSIVFINGLSQKMDADYTLSPEEGTITFISALDAQDTVEVYYTIKEEI